MGYDTLRMVKAFQKRFHCSRDYVLKHNPEHLLEELKELTDAIAKLYTKAEEVEIPLRLNGPLSSADVATLAHEFTDAADAVIDMQFLLKGVWAALGLNELDEDHCMQAVTEANMAKVYASYAPKRAIKMPLWKGPEERIQEVILARAKATENGEQPWVWTRELAEHEQERIKLMVDKCGPTECAHPQRVALRIQYTEKKTGDSRGKTEHFGITKPKDGCYKTQGMPCPKKCDMTKPPAMATLMKAVKGFHPPTEEEEVQIAMTFYGYKEMPPNTVTAFRQLGNTVGAKAISVGMLKDPPSEVSDGPLFEQTMANLTGHILASFPVSRDTLGAIRQLIIEDQRNVHV